MNAELYEKYLTFDQETRDRLLLESANVDYFRRRLGDEAYDQIARIANNRIRLKEDMHLAAGDAENLVFVPGIMGSLLKARVGAGVWWIDAARSRDKIDLLGLDPDGEEVKDEKRHVVPFALDNAYEAFAYAAYDAKGMMPVHHFYDWRKSIAKSTADLAARIEQTWKTNGNRPVHVVSHSMGGLLVRATLHEHSDRLARYLGRIVFIATPHYGSPTIAYYVREHIQGTWAMWLMGRYLGRSTFRSLWGAMNLLPAPEGVYPGTRNGSTHPCLNFDCFAAEAWRLDLDNLEQSNFQKSLDQSREFHRGLFQSHQKLDLSLMDKMAMIVGVGFEMPFRVDILPGHIYDYRTSVTKDRRAGDVNRDSDGSVPVASAQLEGLAETRYVKGEHAALPNLPSVYGDVFRFLRGEKMQLSTTAEGALAGHLAGGDESHSMVSHLDQSADKDDHFRMENRWRTAKPTEQEWRQLETDLAQGQLPQFERVKLL